jgi:hypothetical protein
VKTNAGFWVIAIVLAVLFGVWLRVSGPAYPISGETHVGRHVVAYRLERTHVGAGDHVVRIFTGPDLGAVGTLAWRDHEPPGPWNLVEMKNESGTPTLSAVIPHRAPPHEVDYRVLIRSGDASAILPPSGEATLRFRNDVLAWALIPHGR